MASMVFSPLVQSGEYFLLERKLEDSLYHQVGSGRRSRPQRRLSRLISPALSGLKILSRAPLQEILYDSMTLVNPLLLPINHLYWKPQWRSSGLSRSPYYQPRLLLSIQS